VWGTRRDALDAPIIGGTALVLHHLRHSIDLVRLGNCLTEVTPRQLHSQVAALRELTTGTAPTLTAMAIMANYNKRPGRKIEVTNRSFGGGSINARSARTAKTPPNQQPSTALSAEPHRTVTIASTRPQGPTTVPAAIPPAQTYTNEQAEAVAQLYDQPNAAIADQLGISTRTVRRIRADLGLGRH